MDLTKRVAARYLAAAKSVPASRVKKVIRSLRDAGLKVRPVDDPSLPKYPGEYLAVVLGGAEDLAKAKEIVGRRYGYTTTYDKGDYCAWWEQFPWPPGETGDR